MHNTLITHLQLFGIGFSFGIMGPCLLLCAPIIITYVTGSGKRWRAALADIFIFLSGRLTAYLILGYTAGLSGQVLKRLLGQNIAVFFKPLAGALSIMFAVIIITNREKDERSCPGGPRKAYNFTGLFSLGFALGASPCAPLLALLFDIALMSKNAFDGMSYALSFGMGTFISGFLVIGALSGILSALPAKFLKSRSSARVFKIICALLLAALGISMLII